MKIIRKQLTPVSSSGVAQRYDAENDVVQSSTDGGETWFDNPDADPRHNTELPPPDTSDPKCDAAARIAAQFEEWVDLAITNLTAGANTSFIAQLIYSGLATVFGVVWALISAAIFALAAVLAGVGVEDLTTEFTAEVWERIRCYLYDALGTDAVLTEAEADYFLDVVYANESITVFNVLAAMILVTGEAALNGYAFLRSETGDCESCASCDPYTDSLQDGMGAKTYIGTWALAGDGSQITPGSQGEWIASGGHTSGGSLRTTARGGSNRSLAAIVDFGKDCIGAHFDFWWYPGANLNSLYLLGYTEDLTLTINQNQTKGAVGWQHVTSTQGYNYRYLCIMLDCNLTGEQLVRLSEIFLNNP